MQINLLETDKAVGVPTRRFVASDAMLAEIPSRERRLSMESCSTQIFSPWRNANKGNFKEDSE